MSEPKDIVRDVMVEMSNKIRETTDDLILTSIIKVFGDTMVCKTPLPKKLVERALICFREEHPEEYYKLMAESEERMKDGRLEKGN